MLILARLKVSLRLMHPNATETQLRDWLINTVQPRLISVFQSRILAVAPETQHTRTLKLTAPGDGVFDVYPKLILWGDVSATRNQVVNRLTSLENDFETILREEVAAAGGTILRVRRWHALDEVVTIDGVAHG